MSWERKNMPDWRQRGRTVPAIPEDGVTTLTEDQKTAARRTVAQNAIDAKDAAELMYMLGVFPHQETDEFQAGDSFRTSWS